MSEYERQYQDGSDPKVLDIVAIPMLRPEPGGWQTENWLLDHERYWRKVGRYSPLDLAILGDTAKPLWLDGHSTYHGRNDKIPNEALDSVSNSLRLIRVAKLELAVFAPGEAFGNRKRRVQGRFVHAGAEYALRVTDPGYERKYLAKRDGTYPLGESYLTISLGEPFGDACYKLIAAVIEPHRW